MNSEGCWVVKRSSVPVLGCRRFWLDVQLSFDTQTVILMNYAISLHSFRKRKPNQQVLANYHYQQYFSQIAVLDKHQSGITLSWRPYKQTHSSHPETVLFKTKCIASISCGNGRLEYKREKSCIKSVQVQFHSSKICTNPMFINTSLLLLLFQVSIGVPGCMADK